MTHYSEIPPKSPTPRVHTKEKLLFTTWENCTELRRCHNAKKCPHCAKVRRQKEFTKAYGHLTEKHIKNYKYKHFLTFVSLDTSLDHELKNACIDNFMKDLLKGKRYKSSMLNNSQYFTAKHISYSKNKGYNPHLHMILLSQKNFKYNKNLKKLLKKYNLRVDSKLIYKENNNYISSIKRLINYSLKIDTNRLKIERLENLTKGKRDIYKSAMFSKFKMLEKDKRLYRDILETRAFYRKQKSLAVKIYKRYNKANPKTYLRMLKSLKKKLYHIDKRKNRALLKVTQ